MAKAKVVDPSLHSTRGTRYKPKLGLTGIISEGSGFSRKANMFFTYKNFNKEGQTNQINWFINKP